MTPDFLKTTIYVELLSEGTQVWRPVEAIELRSNTFVLLSSDDAATEEWPFKPGEIVSCESRVFADGSSGLVATVKIA